MAGSIRIERDLLVDPAFKPEPYTQREAYIWLIAEAAYLPREKRIGDVVVALERGQLAASTRFMAKAWKWSEARVRRYLERLQKWRKIDASADAGVTVITVCGYDKSQSTPKTSDAARGRKATRQRRTTDANENKDAIRKEDTDVSSAHALARVASEEVSKDFVAHRRELGKPLSDIGVKALVTKLQDHPDPDAVLRTSIANGWPSVFPDKNSRAAQSQPKVGETRTLASGQEEVFVGGFEGWMSKG